jgi:hypothetical protein
MSSYTLNIFSSVSGILPVIAALYNYRYLDKVLKIAAAFFLVSAVFDLVLQLVVRMGINNNHPLIYIFIIVSVLFFAAIYFYASFNPKLKKAILILSAIVLLIILFNVIFIESIWDYPSLSITVLGVLLIFFSLMYFYQLLNRQEFIHIEKQGLFWINTGVLFYFSINLFLFMLFRQILLRHPEYYMIHDVTNIIANILYSVGLLCKPQKKTSFQY